MNDIILPPQESRGGAHMETDKKRGPMRVLILEDVPTDAEITLRELRNVGIPFVSQRVDNRDKFEEALREFTPDLILSDFSLPASFDGLTALDIARKTLPDVPYVFVSGTIGEDRAVEALKRGATDYVLKDRLNRLVPVIQRALEEAAERTARRRAEQELQETRSRLESIVSSLPDIIWSVSPDPYRLLYASPSFKAAWGQLLDEIYRNPDAWFEIVHPTDRPAVEDAWRAAMRGEALDCMYRIVRKDGVVRWINNRAQAIRDNAGRIVRVDGIARDITKLKAQEEHIARLNRIRVVLSGINSTIVRMTDRKTLFQEACRIAVEDGGFRFAWVGALDRRTLEVEPLVWWGQCDFPIEDLRASIAADSPRGQGTTAAALRTRKPVVINDIAMDSGVIRKALSLERGFRALVALPLLVEGDVFGVLKLYAAEPGIFDDEEVRLLEELAGDISFALDHIGKSERLNYLAYYDGLTGLPNRSLFHERVVQLIHSIAPENQGVAMAVLDLERFRRINETLGMAAGDAVLKQFAERLSVAVGEPATAARISADRFAVAMVPMTNENEIARVLEHRIFAALDEPFLVDGRELRIPVKAGVALYPSDGRDAAALYVNAEAALTQAKQSGKRFLFYAPQMNSRVAERLTLENRLRSAILEEQFILYYQPKVDLSTGEISGLEALLRWASPDLGLVSPAQFVSILEETGMMLDVGRWALRRAIADHAAWCERGLQPPRIAVNVSVIQLRQEQFVAEVRNAVEGGGASGRQIDLEITESMIMEDIAGSILKLAEIKTLGVGLSLDDFGTGYSSLSYIAKLPVNTLKIDRSFIAAMSESSEHMAIVSAVISLARALNLKVVAEGVETQEQSNLLRLLRCDEGQGYVFHPPLPPEKVERLFASPRS